MYGYLGREINGESRRKNWGVSEIRTGTAYSFSRTFYRSHQETVIVLNESAFINGFANFCSLAILACYLEVPVIYDWLK